MLTYRYEQNVIHISETVNENDMEFHIRILQENPYLEGMKLVQRKFEDDEVCTDALFYLYPNHEYRVIVRKDYYIDFVLELMKHRLLKSVEWMP
jgi:hypothetical protein